MITLIINKTSLFGYKNRIEVKGFPIRECGTFHGQLDKPEYFMIALVFEYKERIPVADKACNYVSRCNIHNLQ